MFMLNQVVQGDCINLMQSLEDGQATLTLTDIPYGVISRKSGGLRCLDKKNADIETFDLEVFLSEIVRVTSGSIYIFCSTEQVSFLRSYLVESGLTTRLCIWDKTNPSPMNGQHVWLSSIECCVFGKKKGAVFNEHCKGTVWRYPIVRGKSHPTEKPLALFSYLVQVSSNPNDLVFDPCVGSGTTAVAAVMNGRQFLAFELDHHYIEIARDHINDAKNQV